MDGHGTPHGTIHVGISDRAKKGDGGHRDVTINLSGIPATASESYIRMMMSTANLALDIVTEELESRIRGVVRIPQFDLSAIDSHDDGHDDKRGRSHDVPVDEAQFEKVAGALLAAPVPVAPSTAAPSKVEVDPDPFETASETAYNADTHITAPAEIPAETDVQTSSEVFGCEIPLPPSSWLEIPVTEISNEGGPGQLTAINAGLTKLGYGGKDRYAAAQIILQAYGPICGAPVIEAITSIRDLNKAEASIVLSFLKLADDEALNRLRIAFDVTTGQSQMEGLRAKVAADKSVKNLEAECLV